MSELNIPETWADYNMTGLCKVQNGQTPKGLPDKAEDGDVIFIKVSDMNSEGNEEFIENAPIMLGEKSIEKFKLNIIQEPSIIFPKNGGALLTNKKRKLVKKAAIDTNIMSLTPPVELYDFFWWWFQTVDFKKYASGSTVPKISGNDIKGINLPIPPLKEQKRIVEKIESCFAKIDETEQHLTKVETLLSKYRESLLAKAFRGELVPQDPNDEPASVLLSKIRKEREANQKGKQKLEFAPISDDEKPFEIPASWEWVRLGELLEFRRGHNPPKSEFIYKPKNGYVRFVQIQDFKGDEKAVYVPDTDKLKKCVKGDIMVCAYRHI